MTTVYFQTKGIKPEYCEVGMIHDTDKEHIWYLNEPAKILISEVKIISEENVFYNVKNNSYKIKIKNMTDITKCEGQKGAINCPYKENCYRYTAKGDEIYQSYFMELPLIKDKCDYYWGENGEKIWSTKER